MLFKIMFVMEIKRACFPILLLNVVAILYADNKVSQVCPAHCRCFIIRARDDKSSTEEGSKVKCSWSSFERLIMEDLKLNDVKPHILQLKISSNITYLENSFLKLHLLEKLDLSRNEIEGISDEAFINLKNLKRLDLSYNKIENLQKEMFESLHSLERLKLNNNLIVHIFEGVFESLMSLKTL